uniref:Uncharacterized protein n=1 Tax=Sphaerodactylus townsendi TaxID=933632 RepID=A0ACB8EL72_9SAUR
MLVYKMRSFLLPAMLDCLPVAVQLPNLFLTPVRRNCAPSCTFAHYVLVPVSLCVFKCKVATSGLDMSSSLTQSNSPPLQLLFSPTGKSYGGLLSQEEKQVASEVVALNWQMFPKDP